MQYRKFGSTDLKVSEIGFGAWAIGGNAMVGNTPIGWGKADDEVSVAAIRASLDRGINFFDTADFYGLGHSETLLGTALQNNPDVVIATKVGHRAINGAIQVDYSKEYIVNACELSLQRLQRNTIDYYQLHTARMSHFETTECVAAMELLQQQGKIRYWGLSLNTFHPEPEAALLMKSHWGSGFQLVFNIINQRAKGIMQQAKAEQFGVIARMPLQFGLLTGKFSKEAAFTQDDHRSFRFNKDILADALAALEQLVWPLCAQYGISKTALALSYILSYDAVSTVIPGIRTPQHALDNTTGIVQLAEKDIAQIESAFDTHFSAVVAQMEQQG